jgi:BirA family biotin operon repressor/biotin-[acetyl-CoA-carboxylase] ligase
VLVGGEKLAGILVEASMQGGLAEWAVVGIGLNVSQGRGELPEGGTSLALCGAPEVDRGRLVVALLVSLEERLAEPNDTGLSAYRARCVTLGQEVRVERATGTLFGTALDVEPSGALVVATPAGLESVTFGDVVHLRTAEGGRA